MHRFPKPLEVEDVPGSPPATELRIASRTVMCATGSPIFVSSKVLLLALLLVVARVKGQDAGQDVAADDSGNDGSQGGGTGGSWGSSGSEGSGGSEASTDTGSFGSSGASWATGASGSGGSAHRTLVMIVLQGEQCKEGWGPATSEKECEEANKVGFPHHWEWLGNDCSADVLDDCDSCPALKLCTFTALVCENMRGFWPNPDRCICGFEERAFDKDYYSQACTGMTGFFCNLYAQSDTQSDTQNKTNWPDIVERCSSKSSGDDAGDDAGDYSGGGSGYDFTRLIPLIAGGVATVALLALCFCCYMRKKRRQEGSRPTDVVPMNNDAADGTQKPPKQQQQDVGATNQDDPAAKEEEDEYQHQEQGEKPACKDYLPKLADCKRRFKHELQDASGPCSRCYKRFEVFLHVLQMVSSASFAIIIFLNFGLACKTQFYVDKEVLPMQDCLCEQGTSFCSNVSFTFDRAAITNESRSNGGGYIMVRNPNPSEAIKIKDHDSCWSKDTGGFCTMNLGIFAAGLHVLILFMDFVASFVPEDHVLAKRCNIKVGLRNVICNFSILPPIKRPFPGGSHRKPRPCFLKGCCMKVIGSKLSLVDDALAYVAFTLPSNLVISS